MSIFTVVKCCTLSTITYMYVSHLTSPHLGSEVVLLFFVVVVVVVVVSFIFGEFLDGILRLLGKLAECAEHNEIFSRTLGADILLYATAGSTGAGRPLLVVPVGDR